MFWEIPQCTTGLCCREIPRDHGHDGNVPFAWVSTVFVRFNTNNLYSLKIQMDKSHYIKTSQSWFRQFHDTIVSLLRYHDVIIQSPSFRPYKSLWYFTARHYRCCCYAWLAWDQEDYTTLCVRQFRPRDTQVILIRYPRDTWYVAIGFTIRKRYFVKFSVIFQLAISGSCLYLYHSIFNGDSKYGNEIKWFLHFWSVKSVIYDENNACWDWWSI